jgi:hypothetical protein
MVLGNSVWKKLYVTSKPSPYNDLNRYMLNSQLSYAWQYIHDTSFLPIQNTINFTANLQF